MDKNLLQKDLAELKAICSRIIDRQLDNSYPLSGKPHHGLTFEEVLALVHDDFITETLIEAEKE